MTAAADLAAVVNTAATCTKCRRPGGKDRARSNVYAALFATTPLVVCDRCWHAVGGPDAIQATIAADGTVEVAIHGAPEFEALLAELADHDHRHPIDRLLISSGIRWSTLRHIAGPARCDLVRWVLERTPAPHTRRAESPDTWIDAVTDLIRDQSGTEFRYNTKRRRWWLIANVFRQCGQWDARPLTWISQDEIAAAVGCSTRTVRRCVAWMLREGLLHEVLPGCQLPRQATPDDETATERADRHARRAAAIAAEDRAIARARAELATVTAELADSTDERNEDQDPAQTEEWMSWLERSPLIQLTPVYELRVPVAPAQTDGAALTSTNTPGSIRCPENGHPPQVIQDSESQSKPVHPVDNRPASPGSNDKSASGSASRGGSTSAQPERSRQSEAARAAHWLLHSRLHPDLCIGVSQRWLAALIRDSRLLPDWDWTWDDLADHLHGMPDYPHLPRWIRNPRGWIKARLRRADGRLSPTKLALIQQIERTSPAIRRRHALERDQSRRADIAALRATITECPFCDELGWHDADPTDPGTAVFRCNHDPETGGW